MCFSVIWSCLCHQMKCSGVCLELYLWSLSSLNGINFRGSNINIKGHLCPRQWGMYNAKPLLSLILSNGCHNQRLKWACGIFFFLLVLYAESFLMYLNRGRSSPRGPGQGSGEAPSPGARLPTWVQVPAVPLCDIRQKPSYLLRLSLCSTKWAWWWHLPHRAIMSRE